MRKRFKMNLPYLFMLFLLGNLIFLTLTGWLFEDDFINIISQFIRHSIPKIVDRMAIESFNMEIPYLGIKSFDPEDPPMPIALYLFETFTTLEPTDLSTLFVKELPGLSTFNEKMAAKKPSSRLEDSFMESTPPTTVVGVEEKDLVRQKENSVAKGKENMKDTSTTSERVVFIYHTHNTESWTFTSDNPSVTDGKTNITLVGKKLSEELAKRGIRAQFDDTDHQKRLKEEGLPYVFSYAESLKTVKEALKQNHNIGYIFDIHRDSMPRKVTTTEINGKSYARTVFVIGKGNPHWKKNEELANEINLGLNKKYPGLSRGVDHKGRDQGNGEYNQSLSPNSVLIEVGGIDNTLEECYNTALALADVVSDIYFKHDKKVDAPVHSQ